MLLPYTNGNSGVFYSTIAKLGPLGHTPGQQGRQWTRWHEAQGRAEEMVQQKETNLLAV